jgi:DNA adenine methylase
MTITKPILKWVGGKTQILSDVLELFPAKMNNYHEPFVGGGSVLLGLLSKVAAGEIELSGDVYASDVNPNLIAFYENVKGKPEELIAEVKALIAEYGQAKGTEVNRKPTCLDEALTSPESYYFWIRARFNALAGGDKQDVLASAMLLFLNKTCFRGLYREGPNGFNVPFGNYKNPAILDEAHIREVSALIKDVEFTCCSFTDSLLWVDKDDFFYLDPPYAPETDTSFVGYTADGFGLDLHKQLFQTCRDLEVPFVMSNADVKLVRESFPEGAYKTKIISCRRAINSKNPEAKTNEVLISSCEGVA